MARRPREAAFWPGWKAKGPGMQQRLVRVGSGQEAHVTVVAALGYRWRLVPVILGHRPMPPAACRIREDAM